MAVASDTSIRPPGSTHLLLVCILLLHLHVLRLLLNLLSTVHVLLLLLHHVRLLLSLVGSSPVHVVSSDAVIVVLVLVVVVVADGAVDGLHFVRLAAQVVHGTLRLVQAVAVAAAAVLVTLQGTAYEDRRWEGMQVEGQKVEWREQCSVICSLLEGLWEMPWEHCWLVRGFACSAEGLQNAAQS